MVMQLNRALLGRWFESWLTTLVGRDLNHQPKILQLAALPFDRRLL